MLQQQRHRLDVQLSASVPAFVFWLMQEIGLLMMVPINTRDLEIPGIITSCKHA